MKPGFCSIVERDRPGEAVRRIIATFSQVGVVLTNSYTGRITKLAEDGEQVEATAAGLIQDAIEEPELIFQLWFSSDTNVNCVFKHVNRDLVRHGYSVDGLDANERERLVQWAINYFRGAVRQQTAILLVVDPAGVTVDVEWDAVASETIPFPAILPPILGLPASWTSQLPDYSAYSRERIGDFELLTS